MYAWTDISCLYKGGMASRTFHQVEIEDFFVRCYREVGLGNPEYKGKDYDSIQLSDLESISVITNISGKETKIPLWINSHIIKQV